MRRFKLIWPLLLLLALAAACASETPRRSAGVTDDDVNRVARELYCPICENTPLDACETQECKNWRELIRDKLEAGESDQEIIEYFAEIYGERVRATPARRELSLLVWILPLVAGVVGVACFVVLSRRWLARGTAAASTMVPAPPMPAEGRVKDEPEIDEYAARLEREIRESS